MLRPVRFLPLLCAFWLASCASAPAPEPLSTGPRPLQGWLATQPLEPADLELAQAAQINAAESGRRASWRSPRGHFGVVEPGAETQGASGPCRAFAHTLYIDGRAQRGAGTACRNPAGGWEVVS